MHRAQEHTKLREECVQGKEIPIKYTASSIHVAKRCDARCIRAAPYSFSDIHFFSYYYEHKICALSLIVCDHIVTSVQSVRFYSSVVAGVVDAEQHRR